MIAVKNKINKKNLFACLALLGGNLFLFLTIWLLSKYDQIHLDQILYQMKSPASGAHKDLLSSAFLRVGVFGFALTAAEILLYLLLSGKWRQKKQSSVRYAAYCAGKLCRFFKRSSWPFIILTLTAATVLFVSQLQVFSYINTSSTESDFILLNYVDPESAELTFPEEKRNLVYIFLESMECTYADQTAGGSITDNFIPELTALAEENVSFSHTEGLGGARSYTGTTWTAAAMVAQTSGIVVKVPLTADTYGGEDAYIPGVVSLGEILEDQGYSQTLLLGSDASFAGRDSYFIEHGNYTIVDINSLKEEGRLPEDYNEWWGYEDQKLFSIAKEELTALAESGAPFNFTMLTADTHFPDGYLCPLCQNQYEDQYANVLACSSRQVAEFVAWIQQQPFYENTTIVISGDHLTMDPDFLADIDETYQRTIYNCFINAPVEPENETNRQFGTFDMFPTTLAALNVEIEGDRLGLGTNLFSAQETLTETYGYDVLNEELQKKSVFYNTKFLGMESSKTAEP